MAEPDPPNGDEALSNLRRRVGEAQAKNAPPSSQPPQSAASLALRFGGEFGAAILVGFLIGFGADHFLNTRPWGLVIGLALGFLAGVINVVRTAQTYARANPVDPHAPSVPDDDERDA